MCGSNHSTDAYYAEKQIEIAKRSRGSVVAAMASFFWFFCIYLWGEYLGSDIMKRKKWIAGILGIAAAALFFSARETRETAAKIIAGKGMVRLVEQSVTEPPKVALTFDDGPSSKYTPTLLAGLKERQIHATFFLMGKNIQGNEKIVKQMQEEGHLIGNHTYNHVQLDKISVRKAREEIEKTSNEIYEITGRYPTYIRPPFGAWRKDLDLSVTMFPVFWDVDTMDWKSKNVSQVMQIVNRQVHDGAIILMHDGYQTSVEAALQVVDTLTKEGYEFVTVDQLLVM